MEIIFFVRGMNFCEFCSQEKRNDEWRKHKVSQKHLEIEHKNYCEVCKKKYIVWNRYHGDFKDKSKAAENHHKHGSAPVTEHHPKEKSLEFYSS